MKRFFLGLVLAFGLVSLPARADDHPCAKDAISQAKALLVFHYGPDDRIYIEPKAERMPPLKNPAGRGEIEVLQVWGSVYKASYRLRLLYSLDGRQCLLLGQEVLEFANL